MTFTKICPACSGNGYVPDSDGEQTGYRDCEVCDSQGEVVPPMIIPVEPPDEEQTGYRDCEVCDSQGVVPDEELEHPV
jgi:DnaJ-class molecular chaperone